MPADRGAIRQNDNHCLGARSARLRRLGSAGHNAGTGGDTQILLFDMMSFLQHIGQI